MPIAAKSKGARLLEERNLDTLSVQIPEALKVALVEEKDRRGAKERLNKMVAEALVQYLGLPSEMAIIPEGVGAGRPPKRKKQLTAAE